MTETEIIILIIGIVFVCASFFFSSKEKEPKRDGDADPSQAVLKIKEAAAEQEAEMRKRIQTAFEEQSSEFLTETKEKLSQISNDKIIAVDEFARQVLEKIENNNQEVIFLYDMFQKKEEEMKSVVNKLEQVRRENRELCSRIEAAEQTAARLNMGKKDDKNPGQEELEGTEQIADKEAKEQPEEITPEEQQRKDQVLALYRSNKSVKEISRLLSIGQGEVRLIVDLYGK